MGVELALAPDLQGLVGELVDDAGLAIFPSIMGAVLDEVVGPDMIWPLGFEPTHEPSFSHSRPRLGSFAGL